MSTFNNPFINAAGDAAHLRYPDIQSHSQPDLHAPQPAFGSSSAGAGWAQPATPSHMLHSATTTTMTTGPGYTPYSAPHSPVSFGPQYNHFSGNPYGATGSTSGLGHTPYTHHHHSASLGSATQFQQSMGGYTYDSPYAASSPTGYQNGGGAYTYGGGYGQPSIPPPPIPHRSHSLAEFDPLANQPVNSPPAYSSQSQPPSSPQPQWTAPQYAPTHSFLAALNPRQPSAHPRAVIQSYRQELEAWEPYAWKQALNSLEELGKAWTSRKGEITRSLNGYGLTPEDGARLHMMLRDATANIDTITASTVQMKEVQSGYRLSSDPASKRRVREFLNGGVQSLPDWPQ